jgi:hypothetical protein
MTTFIIIWREDSDDETPWRVAATDNCDAACVGEIHAATIEGALLGIREHMLDVVNQPVSLT